MSRPRVSVLVPVTGDFESIEEVHHATVDQLQKLGPAYELVYLVGVPSASTLDRVLALRELDEARVRVLHFGRRIDHSSLLAAGFERSRGEILFLVPPYFDAEASALSRLFGAIEGGADFAIACRSGWSESSARWQSRLFNSLSRLATGTRFRDIASSTQAMRRDVLEEVPLYGDFHRFLPVLAERVGFEVEEIDVEPHPRTLGVSLRPARAYLWRALDILSIFFVSRFTRRPLRLFGGVGSLFAVSGVAVLGVAAIERMMGTPLADRPVLVLGTLLLGLGVQTFTIGLLGELILFFHARDIRDYRVAAVYEAADGGLDAGPMEIEPDTLA